VAGRDQAAAESDGDEVTEVKSIQGGVDAEFDAQRPTGVLDRGAGFLREADKETSSSSCTSLMTAGRCRQGGP
jgi:hypothetical protein